MLHKKLFFIFSVLYFVMLMALPDLASERASVVKEVLDGETLLLDDGRVVRLIGVRATESGEVGEYGRGSYLAQKFMKSSVKGKSVILSHDPIHKRTGHKDARGRILAYVWYSIYFRGTVDGEATSGLKSLSSVERLLNGELIKKGLAYADRFANYQEKESFIRYEQKSKENEVGIWAGESAFYDNLLERAKGARTGAVSSFIPKSARESSYKKARKILADLMRWAPNDYRAYYDRSWLGVDPLNDRVSKENLEDIDDAIERAPNIPKLYAQRHFLLRLLGRHGEAQQDYEKAVQLAGQFGMITDVSHFLAEELETGHWEDPPGEESMNGFIKDLLRANVNDDHFLFFMARYRSLGLNPGYDVEVLFKDMMTRPRFKALHKKYESDIQTLPPRKLLYMTKWASIGWDEADEALKYLEKITR